MEFVSLSISWTLPGSAALTTQWPGAKVFTTVTFHTRLRPLYQGVKVKPSGLLPSPVKPMGSKAEED